jgi:2-(1,2-epoxy-1,2-dihydrophenyl)acetyl-CoA isomerase
MTAESLYNRLVAEGDDTDAPRRVHVEQRGDRAIVTLDESDRLTVLSSTATSEAWCSPVATPASAPAVT